MELTFPLADERHTLKIAKCFADHWPGRQIGKALVINLNGDLGVGKTTFSRGLIQAFGHPGKVKSPTYTLIETYELPDITIIHMDLYRLADSEELDYLGIDELAEEANICLIEWPERGEEQLPQPSLSLFLEHQPSGRLLRAKSHTDIGQGWLQRVQTHFLA